MSITYIVVTVLAASAAAISAIADLLRPDWLLDNMRKYGVPEWALGPLAVIKLTGALGLLIGLAVPPIGLTAALGLTLYFFGAVITVVRARWYSHIIFPLPFHCWQSVPWPCSPRHDQLAHHRLAPVSSAQAAAANREGLRAKRSEF